MFGKSLHILCQGYSCFFVTPSWDFFPNNGWRIFCVCQKLIPSFSTCHPTHLGRIWMKNKLHEMTIQWWWNYGDGKSRGRESGALSHSPISYKPTFCSTLKADLGWLPRLLLSVSLFLQSYLDMQAPQWLSLTPSSFFKQHIIVSVGDIILELFNHVDDFNYYQYYDFIFIQFKVVIIIC